MNKVLKFKNKKREKERKRARKICWSRSRCITLTLRLSLTYWRFYALAYSRINTPRRTVFMSSECKARRGKRGERGRRSYPNTYFIQCEMRIFRIRGTREVRERERERRRVAVTFRGVWTPKLNRAHVYMSCRLAGQGQRGLCGSIVLLVNYCLLQHKVLKSRRII